MAPALDMARAERDAETAVSRPDWGLYLQAPATIGLAGGVLLACLATPSFVSIACALGLVAAGVLAGRRLRARNQAALDAARALERSACAAPWGELATELLPAWRSEVESTRETADRAVQRLAQGFSQMVVGLTAALAESKRVTVQAADGGVAATIAQSSERLQAVVELLKTLQAAKQAVLENFAVYARNLREMTGDVQAIATQIKLVALNGSIEAARAGEQGKAFAVVVAEMRQLAAKSAELGVKISANLHTVNGTLERSFFGKQRPGDEDVSPITKADQHVKSVLEAFEGLTRQLAGSISRMEQRSEALKREISDALVDFQFQDRVSQQLAWLAGSIDRLRQGAADGIHEQRGWGSSLRRLAAREEARGIHKDGTNRGRPSEVTYF